MKAVFPAAAFLFVFSFAAVAHSGSDDRIVTVEWLSQHMGDKNLVLLHAGWTRGGYKSEHIPNARFLWLRGLAVDTPDLSTQLPPPNEAEAMLRDLGITNRSRIVVYFEGQSVTMTARMILTMDYLGLADQVSYLDGGLEEWKRQGHSVTKELPKFAKGTFSAHVHPEFVADAEWIQNNLNKDDVTIIDARSTRFYEGNGGGMPRAGHIPGAVNIPFTSVADSLNLLLPRETLKEMFLKAGVKPGNKVVTYCHVGQQASLLYFVARYLGYDARLYDGSFEDWSSREDLPVVNPAEKQ